MKCLRCRFWGGLARALRHPVILGIILEKDKVDRRLASRVSRVINFSCVTCLKRHAIGRSLCHIQLVGSHARRRLLAPDLSSSSPRNGFPSPAATFQTTSAPMSTSASPTPPAIGAFDSRNHPLRLKWWSRVSTITGYNGANASSFPGFSTIAHRRGLNGPAA